MIVNLKVGDTDIEVYDYTYSLKDNFPFNNMEILLRGYLFYDYDRWVVYFDNNRHDFQVPNYTDLERVNIIQKLIMNQYQNIEFYSYDYFDIPICHPILGGKISWKMSNGYESYYDELTNRFVEVDEPTLISIDVTISYNDANISFTMNKMLNPDNITLVRDLSTFNDYDTVILKGLVIYRHFNMFYLLDETGIVNVYAIDNYVCKGDYIRLEAMKTSYGYISYVEWDSYKHTIDILSTDNPVNIPVSDLSLTELVNLKPDEESPYSSYIELTGLLSNSRLYYGNKYVNVYPNDYYTEGELGIYNGKLVRIKAYIARFDDWYETWQVVFTGLSDEIEIVEFTDQEKLNFVKQYLIDIYDTTFASNEYHSLILDILSYKQQLVIQKPKMI